LSEKIALFAVARALASVLALLMVGSSVTESDNLGVPDGGNVFYFPVTF